MVFVDPAAYVNLVDGRRPMHDNSQRQPAWRERRPRCSRAYVHFSACWRVSAQGPCLRGTVFQDAEASAQLQLLRGFVSVYKIERTRSGIHVTPCLHMHGCTELNQTTQTWSAEQVFFSVSNPFRHKSMGTPIPIHTHITHAHACTHTHTDRAFATTLFPLWL